jgi:DNA (cytosine-5)-methyltransferase 1
MKKIKVGSDFSGVGAFDQALKRLGVKYETVFACDMDKYARDTFIHNYGEPKYYPMNVYDRDIPTESLDIYMTSPPCQAFSLAGKRLGKDDKRGILFFNSHEFIQVNKPRFFIFENVKGLLSDDGGKTLQEWINMLAGKSVNGLPVLFAHDDAVPYHLYWQVLNAKKHGVPQNRERVFLIGIRDDSDNSFQFPKEEHLTKRLKDVLDDDVDEKYFLSEKMLIGFIKHNVNHKEKGTGFVFAPKDESQIANCLRANAALCATDNAIKINEYRIRRLTPRECFRLMDFPDTFTWNVSDSQAYKQAGNSIVVNVLYKILKQLPI